LLACLKRSAAERARYNSPLYDRVSVTKPGRILVSASMCLIAILIGASRAYPQSATRSETSVTPPPGNGEITVDVGIYVLNLVALNEVTQTFTLTGYLTEQWKDPRLAFATGPGQPTRHYYRRDAIWLPIIQFDNAAAPREVGDYLLSGRPDGTIKYTEKFGVTVSSNLHLRFFPFDKQELDVVLHPFTHQARRVKLAIDPSSTGISRASYTPLPLWHTTNISYETVLSQADSSEDGESHVRFEIQVVRNYEYYVYRIFLPLCLMVAVSWGVLWIPPSDLNSQLLISVTTVLTLVTFSVALSNILPPVPYLTFYDVFFLDSFFFILVSIGEALLIHSVFYGRGPATAIALRRVTRIALPIFFILTIPILALVFRR
jgi:hypothetical protein